MWFPRIRELQGFNDIFAIVIAYVILLGVLVQFDETPILRLGYVSGLIVMGWASWAIWRLIKESSESLNDDSRSLDE